MHTKFIIRPKFLTLAHSHLQKLLQLIIRTQLSQQAKTLHNNSKAKNTEKDAKNSKDSQHPIAKTVALGILDLVSVVGSVQSLIETVKEIEDFLVNAEDLIDSLSEKNEEIPSDLIIKLINLVGDEYDG